MLRIIQRVSKYLLVIFAGTVIVSCSDSGGGTGPKSNPPLKISSVQPTSGPVGTAVSIKGSGFNESPTGNTVIFDSTEAAIDSAASDYIETSVPEGASSGNIIVAVDGDSVSGPNFTVEQKAPGISSVNPKSGPIGTKVTIKGKNFSSKASDVTIKFNSVEASVNSASETRLETEVPKNATAGPVKVSIKSKSTTGPDFDVLGPKITSVSPDTTVKGSEITIKGEHFSENTSDNILVIGGAQATVSSASKTELVAKVPSGASQDGLSLTVGELSDQADLKIITEIQACYGNDVQLDATLQWVSQGLTSADNDKAEDMAMDSNGNLYMIVRDRGVVGKFDPQGNEIWSKDLSGKLPKTTWRGIAVDGQRIYVIGERQVKDSNLGEAKLEYHASKLINGNPKAGTNDPIIARLDANNGGIQWAQEFGSTDVDHLKEEAVAVLPSGDILVGSIMAGPYTQNNHEPNTEPDVGIAKFTQDGKLEAVKQFGAYQTIQGLSTDDQGQVYASFKNQDGTTIYYVRMKSLLDVEKTISTVVSKIKQPIPYAGGEAVIYGSTDQSVESGKKVYINDAFVQRLDASGNQQWVHQQKFSEDGATSFVEGVHLPGGGMVLTAQNSSKINGLPYLAVYGDDGRPLFIDGSEKSTFFEFEDNKKGRGYPTALKSYQDTQGNIRVYTLGVTSSEWANRDDPDATNSGGGKDMWMTGMTLQCKQQSQ